MRIENAGVLRSDRLRDALLHLENLRACGDERRFEARDLAGNFRIADAAHRRLFVVRAMNENDSARNAGRNADTVKTLFFLRLLVAHFAGNTRTALRWVNLVFIKPP